MWWPQPRTQQAGLEELDDEIRTRPPASAPPSFPMDLKVGQGIDQLGAAIWERWKRLDVT